MIIFSNKDWQHILFLCVLFWFYELFLCSLSANTKDGCSRRLKYLLKMIKTLTLCYSRVLLRFLKDNEKKLFRNLKRSTLKLERNKSHLMFNYNWKKKHDYKFQDCRNSHLISQLQMKLVPKFTKEGPDVSFTQFEKVVFQWLSLFWKKWLNLVKVAKKRPQSSKNLNIRYIIYFITKFDLF